MTKYCDLIHMRGIYKLNGEHITGHCVWIVALFDIILKNNTCFDSSLQKTFCMSGQPSSENKTL
jgi:hypothetical protein